MVGHSALDAGIGVRVPAPQPKPKNVPLTAERFLVLALSLLFLAPILSVHRFLYLQIFANGDDAGQNAQSDADR